MPTHKVTCDHCRVLRQKRAYGPWRKLPINGGVQPSKRRDAASCLSDDGTKVYLVGGYDTVAATATADFFTFHSETKQWSQGVLGDSGILGKRAAHTAVCARGLVWVLGGASAFGCAPQHALVTINPRTLETTSVESTGPGPSPRIHHTCTVVERKLYVAGGTWADKTFSGIHVLDTDTLQWELLSVEPKPPPARSGHTCTHIRVGDHDCLLFLGGRDATGTPTNSIFLVDLVTRRCVQYPTALQASAFTPRAFHHTVALQWQCTDGHAQETLLIYGGTTCKANQRKNDPVLLDAKSMHCRSLDSPESTLSPPHNICAVIHHKGQAWVLEDGGEVLWTLAADTEGQPRAPTSPTQSGHSITPYDCTVVVGEGSGRVQVFEMHWAVLTGASRMFTAMQRHGLAEAASNRVNLPHITPGTFQAIVHHLYHGDLTPRLSESQLVDVLLAADQLMLPDIKSHCELELARAGVLGPKNVVSLLVLADTHHCTRLREACMRYITKHFCSVLVTDDFQENLISSPDHKSLLMQLLHRLPVK